MNDKERWERADEIAERMHLLLWGPPGAAGPGKVIGKQERLRELSLELVRLFRTREEKEDA